MQSQTTYRRQAGLGAVQVLLGLTLIVGISAVAVPKYESFVAKSKVTEGFNLAQDSKAKLSEFYIAKNRFPRTDSEASSISTQSLTPPEFVREIVVDYEDIANDVMIKIFFKDGVLPEPSSSEDYVYLAGNASTNGALIDWSCGAFGIDLGLLPTQCVE
jgi:type IV pilus assembly protein PilA